MLTVEGLTSGQVLQRSFEGCPAAVAYIAVDRAGELWMRVTTADGPLESFDRRTLRRLDAGRCACGLLDLPPGGPYAITLGVDPPPVSGDDAIVVRDVLVGDVWALAGQSNMAGYALLAAAEEPHPQVRALFLEGHWAVARDPLHDMFSAADPVHRQLIDARKLSKREGIGTGPGVSFGKRLHEATGVPQGLLACAHGGSKVSDWDPEGREPNLYRAMLRRIRRSGGRIRGMLWYQGCSEAMDGHSSGYARKVVAMIERLRADLACPSVVVAIAQLARFHGNPLLTAVPVARRSAEHWTVLREQQRSISDLLAGTALVPTIDLPLQDFIHLDARGQRRLGVRFADAMLGSTLPSGGGAAAAPTIALRGMRLFGNPLRDLWDLEVRFSGVRGGLRSADEASGFAVRLPNRAVLDVVYRVDLDDEAAILRTSLPTGRPYALDLYYGYGTAPRCTIVDADDRSIPAFGPVRVALPARPEVKGR